MWVSFQSEDESCLCSFWAPPTCLFGLQCRGADSDICPPQSFDGTGHLAASAPLIQRANISKLYTCTFETVLSMKDLLLASILSSWTRGGFGLALFNYIFSVAFWSSGSCVSLYAWGGGRSCVPPPSLLHFVVVVVVRALALLLLPLSLSFSFYSLLVLFLVVWRSLFVALFLVVVRGGKDLAASGAGVWKGTKNKRNEKTPNHCIWESRRVEV